MRTIPYPPQTGTGMGVYVGRRVQRGHGLGNIFGRLFRSAIVPLVKRAIVPAIKKGAKHMTRKGLSMLNESLSQQSDDGTINERRRMKQLTGPEVLVQTRRQTSQGQGIKRLARAHSNTRHNKKHTKNTRPIIKTHIFS